MLETHPMKAHQPLYVVDQSPEYLLVCIEQ